MTFGRIPDWAKWVSFLLLLLSTYTAGLLWANDAHTENRSSIIENRARLDDTSASIRRIEDKLDKLIMYLLPK